MKQDLDAEDKSREDTVYPRKELVNNSLKTIKGSIEKPAWSKRQKQVRDTIYLKAKVRYWGAEGLGLAKERGYRNTFLSQGSSIHVTVGATGRSVEIRATGNSRGAGNQSKS